MISRRFTAREGIRATRGSAGALGFALGSADARGAQTHKLYAFPYDA
jgi:hypothetical protein